MMDGALFPHECFCFGWLRRRASRGRTSRSIRRTRGFSLRPRKNLPMFVPGWEDSTLGNIFVSHVINGDLSGYHIVKSGPEYMGARGILRPHDHGRIDR